MYSSWLDWIMEKMRYVSSWTKVNWKVHEAGVSKLNKIWTLLIMKNTTHQQIQIDTKIMKTDTILIKKVQMYRNDWVKKKWTKLDNLIWK